MFTFQNTLVLSKVLLISKEEGAGEERWNNRAPTMKQVCIQHFHISYRSAIIRPTHFSDNRLGDAKAVSNLAESLNQ